MGSHLHLRRHAVGDLGSVRPRHGDGQPMIYYTDDDLGGAGRSGARGRRSSSSPSPRARLSSWRSSRSAKLFPRSDRSPTMIPHSPEADRRGSARRNRACFRGRAGQPRLLHLHLPGVSRMSMLKRISIRYLPFADAASDELPLGQLLRLALFQVSVGMAAVMLLGTLNRVMIVELQVPAFARGRDGRAARADRALPRASGLQVGHLQIRHRVEAHPLSLVRHALAVRRPGDHARLASGAGRDVTQVRYDRFPIAGEVLAALAFLMTGLGMHMTQTAGLALAADRATDETRPARRGAALRHVPDRHGRFGHRDRLAAARVHAA
jgi:hypothetical protein